MKLPQIPFHWPLPLVLPRLPASAEVIEQDKIAMMADEEIFSYVEPDLFPVLEELRQREPIFHTPEFGTTREDFDHAMAPHYWEVGASGRRYSRDFILPFLEQNPPIDARSADWQIRDLGLRRLGPDTYLLTYTLHQGERVTRRATIWQETATGWRILYHQGTIVSSSRATGASE